MDIKLIAKLLLVKTQAKSHSRKFAVAISVVLPRS
jgi:hypothetical protein